MIEVLGVDKRLQTTSPKGFCPVFSYPDGCRAPGFLCLQYILMENS